MGFFDKFRRKKTREQIKQLEKKELGAKVGEKRKTKTVLSQPTVSQPERKIEDKPADKEKKARKGSFLQFGDVVVRPHISEKAVVDEKEGKYTFIVRPEANKLLIRQAIQYMYGVTPEKIRVINLQGKDTRSGRAQGKRSDFKKAIITLPKGKAISIHEGV